MDVGVGRQIWRNKISWDIEFHGHQMMTKEGTENLN